jgi:hypothetical protein
MTTSKLEDMYVPRKMVNYVQSVFEKPRKTSVKEMASEQGLERMDRIST